MGGLALAVLSFVGSHELLSHPLRRPLVARLGEKGFLLLYSLVAFATFAWIVVEFRAAPDNLLWVAPDWVWTAGAVIMLAASILFVGSLTAPNPAMTGAAGVLARDPDPQGVLCITRHPMMWSFALWALVHAAVSGRAAVLILAIGIGGLALFGATMQDRKKAALHGERWAAWRAKTSFIPFTRLNCWPGWIAVVGGIILFLVATWAHPRLGAPLIGFWRL
ncbi:NnrU family protein [Sphingoaurantiacus capsulatus]|uniref:NnrU family protein n=1 Tax=Sphingoaurantiacus capsulatus TaxID=1771310 RepID=A0ABV7XDJ5_9SPHN